MNINTMGKHIREYRLAKKLRQEDLAELAGISPTYVGMVERGEKTPSLETFVAIVNALGVSADMVLFEALTTGYKIKNSLLNDKLEKLPDRERAKIYDVIDTLIGHAK